MRIWQACLKQREAIKRTEMLFQSTNNKKDYAKLLEHSCVHGGLVVMATMPFHILNHNFI